MEMKRVNRAQLRGKPLDEDCKRTYRTSHQYGSDDNRVFCYGLRNMFDDRLLRKCRECGAHVDNAEPPERSEGGNDQKKANEKRTPTGI